VWTVFIKDSAFCNPKYNQPNCDKELRATLLYDAAGYGAKLTFPSAS
jgi:hypothetical protein